MKPSSVMFAMIVLTALGTVAADDRDDRESLERYRAAMDSIWNSAFDPIASTTRYAAIAYSPTTGEWGYSYNYTSRADAMRRALSQCRQQDAKLVGWAKDGYCALATGKDHAYGTGYGSTPAKARAAAFLACQKHSDECRVVLCVFSG